MFKPLYAAAIIAAALPFLASPSAFADELPVVEEVLVAPPNLPVYDKKCEGPPKLIRTTLTIMEREMELEDGKTYPFMTYNGSVPGPLVVGCLGDYVEVTLRNPEVHEFGTNSYEHNIDFHAAVGEMGGGHISHVMPGEEVTFRMKLTKPGVFVYHCAPGSGMIAYHVVNGMNGAIMVLPRGGLPVEYDRAYYVGEQDIYAELDGENFVHSYDRMINRNPSHVVLNGRVGSLTGENALKASVGETVLFIYSEANRYTQVHVIGAHMEHVFLGSFRPDNPQLHDVETVSVPGGSAIAWTTKFVYGGMYALVNHNLIEADLLGAAAHIKVEGPTDPDLMQIVRPAHPIGQSQ